MSQQKNVETQEEALSLLIQAAQLAQSRGTFSLEEARLLSQAVNLFVPPPDPTPDEAVDAPEEPEEE